MANAGEEAHQHIRGIMSGAGYREAKHDDLALNALPPGDSVANQMLPIFKGSRHIVLP
jgi:hypothetical protein